MNPNERLIQKFYDAFARHDYKSMQQLYSDDVSFSDPVFGNLSAQQVRAMWEMLIKNANDLRISVERIKADETRGTCTWHAWYTFSQTGRRVHNIIHAEFTFKNGLIESHRDRFDFWRWSKQALGLPGWILGGTSYLQGKVSAKALRRLHTFLEKSK